jgi:glycosyltransferase involved in cell wall biosynthesis
LKRILFIVSEDWYFVSHRLHLAQKAISMGYHVTLLANVGKSQNLIEDSGIDVIPWSLKRNSYNLAREVNSILEVIKAINRVKPSLIHAVALKPILYSSIASIFTGLKRRVFAFAGLGFIFTSEKLFAKFCRVPIVFAMRLLIKNKYSNIILQNQDDINTLLHLRMIRKNSISLIQGSGVDTTIFFPTNDQAIESTPLIILPARLLWDKGIGDFVNAANILKMKHVDARFILVGQRDIHNPASISESQISEWVESNIIEYWGFEENMPKILNKATIVCLPSYREGFPKVLLEAASCAKPIVTTDVPGCRQAVENNLSGLLVPAKNPQALADAMEKLIHNKSLCKIMGARGLERVNTELSQNIIANKTINLWEKILDKSY